MEGSIVTATLNVKDVPSTDLVSPPPHRVLLGCKPLPIGQLYASYKCNMVPQQLIELNVLALQVLFYKTPRFESKIVFIEYMYSNLLAMAYQFLFFFFQKKKTIPVVALAPLPFACLLEYFASSVEAFSLASLLRYGLIALPYKPAGN